MSDAHDAAHEERRKRAELERLARALDEDARVEREVLARASELGRVPGSERVEPFVRAALAPRRRARAPALLAWIGVAAALVVGVWLARVWLHEPAPPAPLPLGSGFARELAPEGAGASFARFSWRAELPEGGWFELAIYTPELLELRRVERLRASEWSPAPQESAKWKEIRWCVRSFDASGAELPASWARASR